MFVTIHGETKFIPVSTVTLQKEKEHRTHPFHCPSCGNTMNVVAGRVSRISPVLEPTDQITVINTCRSCKAKFTFQDSPLRTDEPAVIVLNPQPKMQYFYCSLGGGATKEENKILEYDKKRIYSYANHAYVHFPYTCHCTNPSCVALYQFV